MSVIEKEHAIEDAAENNEPSMSELQSEIQSLKAMIEQLHSHQMTSNSDKGNN